jgi:hypothetical protein
MIGAWLGELNAVVPSAGADVDVGTAASVGIEADVPRVKVPVPLLGGSEHAATARSQATPTHVFEARDGSPTL